MKKVKGSKEGWNTWENSYFHPLGSAGVKMTDKVRQRLFMPQKGKASKAAKSWDKWENGYFKPLGGGKANQEVRLAHFMGVGTHAPLPARGKAALLRQKMIQKAHAAQAWEDSVFGHSQAQIASARMPQPKAATAASRPAKKGSKKSLVDRLAGNSWVSTAEVDPKPAAKPVRFVDTLA